MRCTVAQVARPNEHNLLSPFLGPITARSCPYEVAPGARACSEKLSKEPNSSLHLFMDNLKKVIGRELLEQKVMVEPRLLELKLEDKTSLKDSVTSRLVPLVGIDLKVEVGSGRGKWGGNEVEIGFGTERVMPVVWE